MSGEKLVMLIQADVSGYTTPDDFTRWSMLESHIADVHDLTPSVMDAKLLPAEKSLFIRR